MNIRWCAQIFSVYVTSSNLLVKNATRTNKVTDDVDDDDRKNYLMFTFLWYNMQNVNEEGKCKYFLPIFITK